MTLCSSPGRGGGVGALASPRLAKIVSGGHNLAPTPRTCAVVEGAPSWATRSWRTPSTTPLRGAVPLPLPGRIER